MKYTGNQIYIRFLEESDAEAMLYLHLRNRDFFQTYTPLREESFYTLERQTSIIQNEIKQREADTKYSFGIFLTQTDELIGNVTLSEVLRGPLQSCFIGYCLDQQHNGKGYMTQAIQLAVQFAFKELKLHRIEAGVMPHNLASIRALEKSGFHKEGIARKNVKINGKWEDHQVLATLADEEEE